MFELRQGDLSIKRNVDVSSIIDLLGEIGGSKTRIWGVGILSSSPSVGSIFQMDPKTFGIVKSATLASNEGFIGIGGNRDHIWTQEVDLASGLISARERSTDDFSILRSTFIGTNTFLTGGGCGGDSKTVWTYRQYTPGQPIRQVFEKRKASNLSVEQTWSTSSGANHADDVGGSRNRLWACNSFGNITERDIENPFTITKSGGSGVYGFTGIGGKK
jgi:hypothetical protein